MNINFDKIYSTLFSKKQEQDCYFNRIKNEIKFITVAILK